MRARSPSCFLCVSLYKVGRLSTTVLLSLSQNDHAEQHAFLAVTTDDHMASGRVHSLARTLSARQGYAAKCQVTITHMPCHAAIDADIKATLINLNNYCESCIKALCRGKGCWRAYYGANSLPIRLEEVLRG